MCLLSTTPVAGGEWRTHGKRWMEKKEERERRRGCRLRWKQAKATCTDEKDGVEGMRKRGWMFRSGSCTCSFGHDGAAPIRWQRQAMAMAMEMEMATAVKMVDGNVDDGGCFGGDCDCECERERECSGEGPERRGRQAAGSRQQAAGRPQAHSCGPCRR